MDEIRAKIEKIHKLYPSEDDHQFLDPIEKNAKISSLLKDLGGHDGVKILLEEYNKEFASLRKILLEDETLFKGPEGMVLGQIIHARIKWCKKFIGIFSSAERRVEDINKELDKIISDESK